MPSTIKLDRSNRFIDLLYRIGCKYWDTYGSGDTRRMVFTYAVNERICIDSRGRWSFYMVAQAPVLLERHVQSLTTEPELTALLADTEAGNALFKYKLNVLHDVISA